MSMILVYGPSGSGKSRAMINLDPKSTGIICSDAKELPFKGWKKNYITEYEMVNTVDAKSGQMIKTRKIALSKSNYIQTKKPVSILKTLKEWNERPEIKTIVWDTMTHAIMYRFMTDPKVDWDFYKLLAREIYDILNYIQKMTTKDVIVIGHADVKLDASGTKIDAVRTIGKLLDEKVEIPSMFTIVLTTSITRDPEQKTNSYQFVTQSDGSSFGKSPEGMFEELNIPNDYNYVLQKIHEYYG